MNSPVDMFHAEMQQLARDGVTVPPNCFVWMNAKFVDYESRSMLKIVVPVRDEMLNPLRVMQGGFITAAFDNAIGPLSYLAARNPCTTLDLHTQFIRPVSPADSLTITARVVSRGPVSLNLTAEAHNEKGKLVASCSSNMIIVQSKV